MLCLSSCPDLSEEQSSLDVAGVRLLTCEEEGVVRRVHLLSSEVRRVATALKVVEEVQEEVQEVKDDLEDEEVERNGGLKVEGEPHNSCVDEMTCATSLSHAMWCATHNMLTQAERD